MDIKKLRREYQERPLDIGDLRADPFDQFAVWFDEAAAAGIIEPNAMALATTSRDGKPSCRTVLMKHFDTNGLLFFTHYQSRKAMEISIHPYASAVFLWKELERQVIVEGEVEKTSREVSAAYFATRPRGSQLSVWSLPQDQEASSREEIENAYRSAEERFLGKEIPCPEFWGGFRIKPVRFEFWQGRANRLHDRFIYGVMDGVWSLKRLAP